MHFITNGYRTLSKDQLDRSKAPCSFKRLRSRYFVSIFLCNSPDTQGLKATSRCGLQLLFFQGPLPPTPGAETGIPIYLQSSEAIGLQPELPRSQWFYESTHEPPGKGSLYRPARFYTAVYERVTTFLLGVGANSLEKPLIFVRFDDFIQSWVMKTLDLHNGFLQSIHHRKGHYKLCKRLTDMTPFWPCLPGQNRGWNIPPVVVRKDFTRGSFHVRPTHFFTSCLPILIKIAVIVGPYEQWMQSNF